MNLQFSFWKLKLQAKVRQKMLCSYFLNYYSQTSPLFPTELRTATQWAALDPQICPQNSDLIAYISGCDISVTHTLSGHEERLTLAHNGHRTIADDPLSAGVPSYVMQEEFSRYQGYWWQPHSNGKPNNRPMLYASNF